MTRCRSPRRTTYPQLLHHSSGHDQIRLYSATCGPGADGSESAEPSHLNLRIFQQNRCRADNKRQQAVDCHSVYLSQNALSDRTIAARLRVSLISLPQRQFASTSVAVASRDNHPGSGMVLCNRDSLNFSDRPTAYSLWSGFSDRWPSRYPRFYVLQPWCSSVGYQL